MNIADVLVILAILTAPILAIQISRYLEDIKENKKHKMAIFRTLMTTRANPLSINHVEALNMIDIEFSDCKNVIDSWKLLLDNFSNYPKDFKSPDYQSKLDHCSEKSVDLLVDLLYEMSKELNYNFDKVHLKRSKYIPQAHADVFQDQDFIRRSLVMLFLGKIAIPIKMFSAQDEQDSDVQTKEKELHSSKSKEAQDSVKEE